MKDKVEVSKIVLGIDGKKIELSLEQARELSQLLNNLFGEQVKIISPITYPIYIPYPTYPRRYPYWEITWGETTSNTTGYSNSLTFSLNS